MTSELTLYEVLGVPPGVTTEAVKHAYEEKSRLLTPERLAGAPEIVGMAADLAKLSLNLAWEVLGDRQRRCCYDDYLGIRRPGEGLRSLETLFTEPRFYTASPFMGSLETLTNVAEKLVSPSRRRTPRKVTVPDVLGLFAAPCQNVLFRHGLSVRTSLLTGHPRPEPGLAVSQSPRSGVRVRRGTTVTVTFWHPAAEQTGGTLPTMES
jgi:curved DNA-binding protein CbpA